MLTVTLLQTAAFLRSVCQVFTNAAGADRDVSHCLAQPVFLQGGKLRLCLCTINHSKNQFKNVLASKWTNSLSTTLTCLDVFPLLWVWGDDSEGCGAEKREARLCVSVVVSTHAA